MTSVPGHLAETARTAAGPRVSFGSWRSAVARDVMRFEFDCDRPRAFAGAIRQRTLAGVDFIDMASGRHAAYRNRAVMTDADTGYLLMTLQLSGTIRISQDDRTAVLSPGTFAVYDSSRPAALVAGDDYRSTCVRFAKDRLGPSVRERITGITATTFDYAPGLPATVWDTLLSVNRNLDALGAHGPSAVRSAMDLVGLLLRSAGGVAVVAPADPLEQVKDFIDGNLGDHDLSPARIAAAHHISARHLHGLFDRTGTTVARWIRTRRIEECRRDLADPSMADIPASRIGARWGFVNPAHFGHVFKQETGLTPATFRQATTSPSPGGDRTATGGAR